MADLDWEPNDHAGTILRPNLAQSIDNRGIRRNVGRLDGDVVEIEGAHVRHQQTPRGSGRAYIAILLKDAHVRHGTCVHNGEAVVDRVGWEQASVDERESTLGFHAYSCLTGAAVDS